MLADDEVMLTIKPGQHGSTYGGNPVGSAVGRAALDVLIEEDLIGNSERKGKVFRDGIAAACPPRVRGRGCSQALCGAL